MQISNRIRMYISSDVIATLFNFIIKLFLKPVVLLLVPLFLNANEQGFWYTFASIAALTTFADLGFTTIITQFAAHEYAHLNYDKKHRVFIDDNDKIGKISSLFRFMIKWTIAITFVACLIILLAGFIIFSHETNNVKWTHAWIIYTVATGFNFILQVIFSFFEGCDQIATVQKIKILNSLTLTISTIILIYYNCKLYALGISLLFSCIISTIQIFLYYKKTIQQLLIIKNSGSKWLKSILRLLWKYAISWTSGYFIFQIYSPLLFATYGAEVAGKVGYTLTIISSIVSIANVWSYVSIPKINTLAEKKCWIDMDILFKRNTLLIVSTYGMGVVFYWLLLKIDFINNILGNRVLGFMPTVILVLAYACQIIISYLAVYLRSHKEEPLMLVSLFSAIFNLVSTVLLINMFGYNFVFLGFLLTFVVTLPWSFSIFKRKRILWHTIS